MDTRLYPTQIDINLNVIGTPDVRVSLDDRVICTGVISSTKLIQVDLELAPGNHNIVVEHCNKRSNDPSTELIITAITFNGISSPKFVWEGMYVPDYPEPWATEQRLAGNTLFKELAVTTHLGWNGKWTLIFTAPVFTWIHRVEDLGWIHQ